MKYPLKHLDLIRRDLLKTKKIIKETALESEILDIDNKLLEITTAIKIITQVSLFGIKNKIKVTEGEKEVIVKMRLQEGKSYEEIMKVIPGVSKKSIAMVLRNYKKRNQRI